MTDARVEPKHENQPAEVKMYVFTSWGSDHRYMCEAASLEEAERRFKIRHGVTPEGYDVEVL